MVFLGFANALLCIIAGSTLLSHWAHPDQVVGAAPMQIGFDAFFGVAFLMTAVNSSVAAIPGAIMGGVYLWRATMRLLSRRSPVEPQE